MARSNRSVEGNGPISAILDALQLPIDVLNYEERSIGSGANAKALALVELQVKGSGKMLWCRRTRQYRNLFN